MYNPKLKGRLHRIDVPTMVVWGDKDGIITPDYGKAFAAEIPGAQFEVIKDAGHFPHLEQPEAFMKLVDKFAGAAKSAT
jgi:pimeloyl-ACP methyl ester carboxylesterase